MRKSIDCPAEPRRSHTPPQSPHDRAAASGTGEASFPFLGGAGSGPASEPGPRQRPKTRDGLALLLGLALMAGLLFPGCGGGSGTSGAVTRSPQGPAMDLASGIYQRGESLRTLAARGGAGYTSQGRRHFFKFEVLVDKPGRMLFTALDPAGRPAFRLASDGQQLTGIMYGSRQYVVGPATAANFGRFIPLGLTPDQLIALMSGSQVRPASAGARETGEATELTIVPAGQPEGDAQLWRLRLAGGLGQNPATAVVQSAAFGPARNPEISIKYMSVKDVPREDQGGRPEPFPHSVEVDWTSADRQSQALRVTYDEIRLGLPLETGLFHLERPNGFELVQLN